MYTPFQGSNVSVKIKLYPTQYISWNMHSDDYVVNFLALTQTYIITIDDNNFQLFLYYVLYNYMIITKMPSIIHSKL